MKHKRSKWPPVEQRPIGRAALAFLGLVILAICVGTFARGKLDYLNWWGGSVFAPFAVFGAALALVAAIRGKPFKKNKQNRNSDVPPHHKSL